MSENVVIFIAGVVMSAIVSYFTAHSAVLSRISSLTSSQDALKEGHAALEGSIEKVAQSVERSREGLLQEVRNMKSELKDEIRTYYQRKP